MLIKYRKSLFSGCIISLVLFGAVTSGEDTFQAAQTSVESLVAQAEQFSRQEGKEFLALKYINAAIKLQPKREDLYYRRAFILGRAGQYIYAVKEFNRFVKSLKYPHAVRFRGDCFMALGDYRQAAKDYSAFLNSAPMDGKVWSYLAEALVLMGARQAALDTIAKGMATESHWSERLRELRESILLNKSIKPHKPFSN
jgi:tetratricopeptide (TPR) repeat protein